MAKRKDELIPKPPRELISHRTFAPWFGTTARTWRRRYDAGQVPAPHQVIGIDLLYDRRVIDYRLQTGQWPPGQTFVKRDRRGAAEPAERS